MQQLSVLIVLTGSLGDLTRALVLPAAIKASRPAYISWLVESRWSELLSLNRHIDRVIEFKREQGVRAFVSAYKELKNSSFDITIDLQRILKSGILSFISGAPRRLAFNRKNSKEFNWFFNNEYIAAREESYSKFNHYLLFLEKLDISLPEKFDYGLDHLELSSINPEISEMIGSDAVGLILGSSWPSKDWTAEGYSKLINRLLEAKQVVVLLGDGNSAQLSQNLETHFNSPDLINLCGRTSITELVAVIKSLSVCTGPDSGPAHIAAAVGTPYVSLFGPTDPDRVAPQGYRHFVVRAKLPCSPCNRRVCPGLNRLCMRLISVEQVYQTLMSAKKLQSNSLDRNSCRVL
ncbi:MAG: glycosyltransferase family 9 protein [Candidatus Dadabacteria bacterium]|nr:MAG: glycosyltransferase family 9 protein [Candidatus Dadabacteria bacterium]